MSEKGSYKQINTLKLDVNSVLDCLQQYGVFIVDQNGQIININQKTQELLNLEHRDEILTKHLEQYIVNHQLLLNSVVSNSRSKFQFQIGSNGIIHYCTLRVKEKLPTSFRQNVFLFSYSVDYSTENNNLCQIKNKLDLFSFAELDGVSASWKRTKELGIKAAKVNSNILIIGESGTGKEMLTQAIHNASCRRGPFIPINCGALPKELLQSELFGYEEGAFTGAKKGGALGKFEEADGGTIFLDEIGEMPIDMQVSLLRFLQDRKVVRVGGITPKAVDVRVISATNRDLEQAIKKGAFREDLYYRLNVINIFMPPLRHRKEDIPLLINNLIRELCYELAIPIPSIMDETIDILLQYYWPGNIRELRNVIEHAVVFAEGSPISPDCLPQRLLCKIDANKVPDLQSIELQHIYESLAQHAGNISATARALGITRSTLYRKLEKLRTVNFNYSL